MRARGPCSTKAMQQPDCTCIGVCKQVSTLRCKARLLVRRLTNKAPLSRHAECRDLLGWDVLPQACGRLWLGPNVPETPSAAGVERRFPCAADIHVTVFRLLLFAPSQSAPPSAQPLLHAPAPCSLLHSSTALPTLPVLLPPLPLQASVRRVPP